MKGFIFLSSVLFSPFFLTDSVADNKVDLLAVKVGPHSQLYDSNGKLFLPSFLATGANSSNAEDYFEVNIGPHSKSSSLDGYFVSASGDRIRRSIPRPSTCRFPSEHKDSHMNCKIYPNRVACTVTCPFGYTFSTGIQMVMTCRLDEDKWEPVPEFENCKPFIDCTLTILFGGKSKCYTRYLHKGPVCHVSCPKFEDIAAVPTSEHRCNIDGKWTPELPFCAVPGSGLRLVAPPNGALHITEK